jgi:hypothetical protein
MAQLMKRMLVIAATAICGAGVPAQAENPPAPSNIRFVKVSCGAWCNTCRPTYACYQNCARLAEPKVPIGCGSLGRLPAVPVPPKMLRQDQ